MLRQLMNKILLLFFTMLLASCAQQEKPDEEFSIDDIVDGRPEEVLVDIASIPNASPQYEPWSTSVNPETYEVLGKTYHVLPTNKGYRQQGIASWYGTKFHQKKTATGEVYDMLQMTAAHKTLPIPSYVQVTNLDNQRSVIVRVNDRGPFHEHRIIDLSYAAAVKLGLDKVGTGFVSVVAVQPGEVKTSTNSDVARKIFLQIGAFGTQKNAVLLQQKVAELRLTTSRIVTSKASESRLFKVQVGPISSVTEADSITEKLKKIGIYGGHFISESED